MGFKEKYNNLDTFGKRFVKGFGIAIFLAIIITLIRIY